MEYIDVLAECDRRGVVIATQAARIVELEGEVQEARSFFGRKRLDNQVPGLMRCITDAYDEITTERNSLRAELDRLKRELAAAKGDASGLAKDRDEARNALMVSEQYRRSYAAGKLKLYAMGGEVCDAATKHLPCSEGPLDRYTDRIEREHSPKLVEDRKYLAEELGRAESQLAASQAQNAVLREAINGALHTSRERATAPGRSARLCTPPMDKSWSDLAKWCVDGFELTESILTSALTATPAASLASVKAGVLREAANLIRQTTPDHSLTEWYRGCASGRRYAIEQIEGMADQLEAAAKGEKDA